jgi:hypothetical protein
MDTLLESLKSPQWWLSVVLVGIVINLASAFLKQRLDGWMKRVSGWYRGLASKKEAERTKRVAILAADEGALLHRYFVDLRERMRSMHLLMLGLFLMLIADWIPGANSVNRGHFQAVVFAISALSLFASFSKFRAANELASEIRDARALRRKEPSRQPGS